MSWEAEVEELKRRVELAKKMGGTERVARHHELGKLTVRERVGKLLDTGSFREIGTLAGMATYDDKGELEDFIPSNFIFGSGKLGGRRVIVAGDDFTVRGGAADARVGNKMGSSVQMAMELKIPLINLVDGSGGGGSVKTIEMIGRTYVPELRGFDKNVQMLGEVPVVSACLGSVAGLGAVRVAASHFSVMVKETSHLFIAGPPVVVRGIGKTVTKEELGGSSIHAHESGVVDNEAETEEEAFEMIGRFLSYLPSNVWRKPPRITTTDNPNRREEELLSIIPRDRRQTYDVRRVVDLVLDRDSFFEISPNYARPLVVGLARLNGYPVGVLTNDPLHGGGAVDTPSSEKMMRFVDLCDTFHLPVVAFVDNPGFLIGPDAERTGTARAGTRALAAVFQATVPWISIMIRRAYGVAGAGHGNSARLNLRYAWPSGDWGSLPIEGGVMAAYKRDIEASPDPEARRKEIEDSLSRLRSPMRTAEAFGVEEIIDPRDTRPLLCDWVEMAYEVVEIELGPKSRTFRP